MSNNTRPEYTKPRKPKNWPHVFGSCKGERFSDGVKAAPCAKCGVVSKKKKCQFCGHERGRACSGNSTA